MLPASHVVRYPPASPPSPARISGAVSRLIRLHAFSAPLLAHLFGPCVVAALARRIEALSAPVTSSADLCRRAGRVQLLVTWLAAVSEAIETENDDAAELRVTLAAIVREAEFIVGACNASGVAVDAA